MSVGIGGAAGFEGTAHPPAENPPAPHIGERVRVVSVRQVRNPFWCEPVPTPGRCSAGPGSVSSTGCCETSATTWVRRLVSMIGKSAGTMVDQNRLLCQLPTTRCQPILLRAEYATVAPSATRRSVSRARHRSPKTIHFIYSVSAVNRPSE